MVARQEDFNTQEAILPPSVTMADAYTLVQKQLGAETQVTFEKVLAAILDSGSSLR